MAISFVAAGTEAAANAGTTVTPGNPAGIEKDDILVVVAACWDGNATSSMGAGWTEVADLNGSTSFASLSVYWCRYDGVSVPSATVTLSGSSGDEKIAGMAAFRGVNPVGSPFNVSGSGSSGTSTTTITHNGVTTTIDGCVILCINSTDENDQRTGLHSGYTNVFEDTTAGTDNSFFSGTASDGASIHMSYNTLAAAGATGTITVTGSGLGGWRGILFALEPAGARRVAPVNGNAAVMRAANW